MSIIVSVLGWLFGTLVGGFLRPIVDLMGGRLSWITWAHFGAALMIAVGLLAMFVTGNPIAFTVFLIGVVASFITIGFLEPLRNRNRKEAVLDNLSRDK